MKKRHIQKLLFLSAGLVFALNLPLLLLFNSAEPVFGMPLLYVYVFALILFSSVISLLIFKRFDE